MGLFITNDHFGKEYYSMVVTDIKYKIFVKKYPCFANILLLSKTLDFKLKIYDEDIMREVTFKPLSL